jgi:hypothetical protein
LTHLKYVCCAEAAGINPNTAKHIKGRAEALQIEHQEQSLPPPKLEEQVARKPGSGAPLKYSVEAITNLIESCILNKKQRKKLWHLVVYEEGFWDYHRRTIEKKLRQRGLRRTKSTKKLELTDLQKAQRYEIALSRKDWGLEE